MQFLWISLISLFLSTPSWETNFAKAKQTASSEHKMILINFSGSDWCGPCIRLHKDIFENDSFARFASSELVLVNADFPRLKKHQLSSEQQANNDQLAEIYNKQGIFPLTLLLTPDGKVIKSWEGYPGISPEVFISQVKAMTDANH
ncbi:MAG: thioredoxin family protein [Flavisolibacter sp.]|jgi:thioredoxin-related protein